jgi:hypothetical protein
VPQPTDVLTMSLAVAIGLALVNLVRPGVGLAELPVHGKTTSH